ncbi:MAG: Hsp20/alpha crystallin family protein [Actinomycetota bacterium]|nr:Hsp20/alpha crystallin family protein [Actinomycetota bacterium]
MLRRFDPFRDFDRIAGTAWTAPGRFTIPMDAVRTEHEVTVYFDLPGVDPGAVDLTVEKNRLTVEVTRETIADDDTTIIARERPQGAFSRQLVLGENLDASGVEASFDNGVLTVRIPVAQTAQPRKVAVSAGGGTVDVEPTAADNPATDN